MTTPNPIEEIKAIRHRLGAEAGYDIHRVFAELRSAMAINVVENVQGVVQESSVYSPKVRD